MIDIHCFVIEDFSSVSGQYVILVFSKARFGRCDFLIDFRWICRNIFTFFNSEKFFY